MQILYARHGATHLGANNKINNLAPLFFHRAYRLLWTVDKK